MPKQIPRHPHLRSGRDRLPEVSAALKAEASVRSMHVRWVAPPLRHLSSAVASLGCIQPGVLQEMNKHGMLHGPKRADYLSSVSGGSTWPALWQSSNVAGSPRRAHQLRREQAAARSHRPVNVDACVRSG